MAGAVRGICPVRIMKCLINSSYRREMSRRLRDAVRKDDNYEVDDGK